MIYAFFKYFQKSRIFFILGETEVNVVKIKSIRDFSFDVLKEKFKLNSDVVLLSFNDASDIHLENSISVVFSHLNVSFTYTCIPCFSILSSQ